VRQAMKFENARNRNESSDIETSPMLATAVEGIEWSEQFAAVLETGNCASTGGILLSFRS